MTETGPEFLDVGRGGAARRIAVQVRDGSGPPVVWLGGFRSDMTATKATALDDWAAATGRKLVRFDYAAHGASGGTFTDCTISTWLEDAEAVLGAHVDEAPILVGSSMGGWLALLLARELKQRTAGGAAATPLAGLVLIAPAVDFTEELMWSAMMPDERARLQRDGVLHIPSQYGDPTPVTAALIADGRTRLLLKRPIPLRCRVRLLHGQRDPDVPWQTSLRLAERLGADDVQATLIKDGDHRLSRPSDLALLRRALGDLVLQDGA